MRRLPIAVVLWLSFAGAAQAQKLGPVDWIFLVDTSKSMRGVGGTKDIFNDVKASIDSFVEQANDGDSVAIYTFDRNVKLVAAMQVDANTRRELHDFVAGIEAEGNRTHLGAAIAKGLQRAEELRKRGGPTRTRAVVLFTDGKEDTRGIRSPTKIDATLEHLGDAFIFFVSMGEHERQLDAFTTATVLHATDVEEIRRVAQEIRAKIPAPPPPKPVVQAKPKPEPPPPPPPPSPLARALRVILPLAVLAAIVLIALQQKKKQNRLEGELEILRPPIAPDLAFVGLPKLQASEVALSSIVPLDALAGSDARLFVRRKGGKKKIWIAASGGSLRINDVETPLGELYDADTIEIGDAKLRFNRVGDERPSEEDSL